MRNKTKLELGEGQKNQQACQQISKRRGGERERGGNRSNSGKCSSCEQLKLNGRGEGGKIGRKKIKRRRRTCDVWRGSMGERGLERGV